MEQEPPSFEESFSSLQATVEELERGGLPLERALDLFEAGMKLATTCQGLLDRAELRLTRLIDEGAAEAEEPEE